MLSISDARAAGGSAALVEFLPSLPWHENVCLHLFIFRISKPRCGSVVLVTLPGRKPKQEAQLFQDSLCNNPVTRISKSTNSDLQMPAHVKHRWINWEPCTDGLGRGIGSNCILHILLFSSYSRDRERIPREKLGAPEFG